ncbi:conserved Plasmodium protein, unknown function [Plasmodium ovale curtisi]|uniref:Uncharacterized protein n=1 Tax=Plasmodium ovale curtisi TaxID=864141 RepID=A0A1A8VYY4_PLAOA|nr:conserved Plasmodium protein, unknown function [Plasmodium ovale curtisi]SBS93029.1 conserved Plasmodium protein, unknown function [Plasmodium ovale curtisi]
MSKKGEGKLYEERTEKDYVLDEDTINDTGERKIEKNQKNNQGNNFNDGESKKIIKKDIDPKMYNKFKNDGSFLDQVSTDNCEKDVLAMQKKKKVRKLKEVDTADFKKKKTKVEEDEEEKNQKDKEGEKESEIDPEDEREIEIEKEYIEKINKMKEEGFFTDKGIGAGMMRLLHSANFVIIFGDNIYKCVINTPSRLHILFKPHGWMDTPCRPLLCYLHAVHLEPTNRSSVYRLSQKRILIVNTKL